MNNKKKKNIHRAYRTVQNKNIAFPKKMIMNVN